MNKLKKAISLLLVIVMALSLCACGDTKLQKMLLGGHKWGENEARSKQINDDPIEINDMEFKLAYCHFEDGKLYEIGWRSSTKSDLYELNGKDLWSSTTIYGREVPYISSYGKDTSIKGEQLYNGLKNAVAEMTNSELKSNSVYVGDDEISVYIRSGYNESCDGYFEIIIRHYA